MPYEEVTIAQVLKPVNYRTSTVGKWHLGDGLNALPVKQGFDYYFGISYGNDMSIDQDLAFAVYAKFFQGYTLEQFESGEAGKRKNQGGKAPLMHNDKIIEYPFDQNYITQRFTDEPIQIILDPKRRISPTSSTLPIPCPMSPPTPHHDSGGKLSTDCMTIPLRKCIIMAAGYWII